MTKLKDFLVLEKLIVESPKVEPGRISATYKVVQFDGTGEQTELIYTYRLKLFDHSDAADLSAAATVFSSSEAIVIGPTPPGTGVIDPAMSTTAS